MSSRTPHPNRSTLLPCATGAFGIFFAIEHCVERGHEPRTPPPAGQVVLREMERGYHAAMGEGTPTGFAKVVGKPAGVTPCPCAMPLGLFGESDRAGSG